jgi:hypothetical protein
MAGAINQGLLNLQSPTWNAAALVHAVPVRFSAALGARPRCRVTQAQAPSTRAIMPQVAL